MELYKVNNDMSYPDSPYVRRNVYLQMEAEDAPLPTYDEVKARLPRPVWDGHADALACYDYAWQIAFRNLRKADKTAGFVSNYIDTAFNGFLFMWDSSFIVMFGKYADKIFSFQKTLDNLYSHQHRDGFICREICEYEVGEHFSRHDPSSTGPNVMAWSEWEYYCQTGDLDRLSKVFDPLLAYHLWLKENHTWRDGSYWSTGWGCGMDNQPRLQPEYHVIFSHGHMVWVDTCIQQVLSAKLIVKMAEILGREEESGITALKAEIENLTRVINDQLWSEEDAFYYDLYKNGKHNGVKTIGAYWALIADIIPADRLERFVAHLDNESEFKRPCRVPSLSADHPAYEKESGDYWRGAVWAPTNYMVLKGLEKNGYEEMAHEIACNCLDNVVKVFNDTHTLWENYAAESASQGRPAKDAFVGWSGLFPISIMMEYVFGIRPYARENKIVWNVNLTDRHGVEQYPLGDLLVDLVCEARASADEEPVVTVKCDRPITVEVHWNGNVKTVTSK
ncbi:MAG: glycoside hydrolase [Clostridia bacterium]|nr:glycoside hydrolase [Clostridia bacterium]